MDTLNLNFSGGENTTRTIFWIFSFLSWLLFLVTGWIAFFYLIDDFSLNKYWPGFWNIVKLPTIDSGFKIINIIVYYFYYWPTQILDVFLYIALVVLLIFATWSFFIYVFKCTCSKDSVVLEGMLGNISRFHFIPILCASGLFIIGEIIYDSDEPKTLLIIGAILSFVGLISMAFVAFKTNIESAPFYISIPIKKGTYGSLIALFTYNACYSILRIGITESKDPHDFKKACGIALPIVIGLVNLCLAYFLADAILACMNLIIYIGATIYYFDMPSKIRDSFNGNADGIIDIIMIVLSCATIGYLIFKNKGLVAHK